MCWHSPDALLSRAPSLGPQNGTIAENDWKRRTIMDFRIQRKRALRYHVARLSAKVDEL